MELMLQLIFMSRENIQSAIMQLFGWSKKKILCKLRQEIPVMSCLCPSHHLIFFLQKPPLFLPLASIVIILGLQSFLHDFQFLPEFVFTCFFCFSQLFFTKCSLFLELIFQFVHQYSIPIWNVFFTCSLPQYFKKCRFHD